MPSTLIAPKTIVASVGSAQQSPSTVRCRALISPALRGRLPALELGLTDPSASVRLVAASQMARLLEHRFQEGGLAPVIAWLSTSVSQPRLFFKERDPRLSTPDLFDRDRAISTARLSSLMVVQAIMHDQKSNLRIPLATYFREQGLFEKLKEGRTDARFLSLCLRSELSLPPFNAEREGAIGFLMHGFKYAVAVCAYQNKDLRLKYFPDASDGVVEPPRAISSRMGILNTLSQLGVAAVEDERDPHVARQLADELCAVVGVFVTVRLPPLATGG